MQQLCNKIVVLISLVCIQPALHAVELQWPHKETMQEARAAIFLKTFKFNSAQLATCADLLPIYNEAQELGIEDAAVPFLMRILVNESTDRLNAADNALIQQMNADELKALIKIYQLMLNCAAQK